MPLSPEAEADLLGLVAKYHFDVIGHNEFDAAVDKVKADRTAQRIYKSFRVTMMQTEPGGSFWEHLPVIQHAQNRAMAAQLSVQPSYAEWVNWCESQQTESRLLGAAGPAPSQEPDAAAEGEQPQFPKTVAPVLKQSKLVIPTRHGERRKSKSPSRLKDFELTGGAAAPSGTRPRGRPQREEEDVVPDDSDEEESLPGRPVARQRKRKQPAVESAGTDAEVDSSADNSFSEDSDGTDPDDPKGKKKAKGKSKKSRKAEKRRKKKARKAPPPLNAQEQKEFEDAAGRRQQPNRQPHAQQPAQQPAQQLVKADPNEANADVGARGSTSVPPPARPSKPARDSLAGRTDQLAAGYFGFKYIGQKIFHGNWREDWMDLYCSEHLLIPAGKNNNLAAHRLICPRNADPVDPSMQPYIPAKRTVRGRKTESLLPPEGSEGGASSYHGPEVQGWLSGQQFISIALTRRLSLIEILLNGLPFTHATSPAHIALIKSIDRKARKALVGRDTVRSDLEEFNALQKEEVIRQLHNHDSLVTLQHDAWTVKGYRYAFVCILATFIDRNWQYQELLLSFKVLDQRHSGATFAGELVDTIEFRLQDKWSGFVVSDSASTNLKMASLLERQFLDRTEDVESIVRCLLPVPDDDLSSQQRRDTQDERMQGDGEGSSSLQPRPPTAATRRGPPPPSSPSSFPSAFQRTGFKWQAEHCAVLCFAHHLNIAIRDGFKAMGIKFAAQMKVIPIPSIVEPAGAINPQTLDDVWPDTKDRPEENKKATAVAGGKDNAGDTGDAGDDDGEIVSGQFLGQAILTTSAEEHAPPSDERGEDDDDDELTFQTADNQVRSIDALGNGPVAIASSDGAVRGTGGDDLNLPRTGTGGVWSAVQRVEGFVVAMHRSAERQHLFRELMRKEYYNQENKAKAALPTKPNDTRWNSQLSTLRSAFNIREAIDAAIAQERDPTHVYKAFAMTEGDWRNIEQLIEFLVLSERISTSVQASGSTLADVLEYHVLMVSQLDDALRTMGDCDGARLDAQNKEDRAKKPEDAPHQMAAALRAIKLKLGKFRDLAVQNRTAVTAALMHPNHRLKLFKDDYRERQDEAEEMLKSALSELLNRGKSPSTPAMAAPEPTVGDSPLKAARMQRLARVEAMKTHDDEDVDDPVEDEIRRYIRNEAAWRNTDGTPETWWKDNEVEFPNLAKLARIYLAVPGSTASVEQVFSAAGWICSSRRGRLSGESLGLLVTSTGWMRQGFDRLLGLDHSGRQAGRPILQEMDETIAETKAKRRKADANRRKRMAMGL